MFKGQLSCWDALCNIWPSCLARFVQVCPWFAEGKSWKPHNYSSFPRINLKSGSLMFPVLQWSKYPPNTTPGASLRIIAEGDQSEHPPKHPKALSITVVALECCEMGPSEIQTRPAITDARIWTSFERLLSEKMKCHEYTWCNKPQKPLLTIEVSKKSDFQTY